MARTVFKPALIAVAICAMAAGTAYATPELEVDGTLVGLTHVAGGLYTFSTITADGWITSGTVLSNSPDSKPGLDLGTLTMTCGKGLPCSRSSLVLSLSDVDFAGNVGANGFVNALTGAVVTGSGSVTQGGYFGAGNSFFDMSGVIGSAALGASVHGGGPVSGPYSLTLVDTFTDLASGAPVTFSTDGFISTPEPGTIALFGAALLGCGLFLGRRRLANRR